MKKNNSTARQKGFTLIEVIVALAISAFLITLVFALFSNASKGILFQNRRAEHIRSMTLYKKRIDAAIGRIHSIKSISNTYCEAVTRSDSLITIQYVNKELRVNSELLCQNIDHFTFSFEEECGNKTILLWECTPGSGGWIGGGAIVNSGVKR